MTESCWACAVCGSGPSTPYSAPTPMSAKPSASRPAILRRIFVRALSFLVICAATSGVVRTRRVGGLVGSLHEVDHGEQTDPDDVDEVPVVRHDDRRRGLGRR